MSKLKMLSADQESRRDQFVDDLILKMAPLGTHLTPEHFMQAIAAVVSKRDEILQLTTGEQA